MTTRTIPRDEWHAELDSFSRRHKGWIVRVGVIGPDGSRRGVARELPLRGLIADSAESDRMAIAIGEQPDERLTQELASPIAIAVEETDTGAERGLRIRTADGSITTVEFQPPMRPEDVDDLI